MQHTRMVPESNLLEIIRLRKADPKNPLISYLKVNHFEFMNF